MLPAIAHRLIHAGGLLIVLSVVGFGLLHLMPGSVPEVLLMAQMDGHLPSREALARFSAEHGFDDPLPAQYLRWLAGVLRGDLGSSLITGEPVAREILLRLRNSFLLAVLALALALAIALPVGLIATRWRGGLADRVSGLVAVLGMAIPNFWYALLLALLFSLVLGWLPSSGSGSWRHAVLPTLVIGTSVCAILTRYVRSLLLDEAGRPYMRTALAKGLSRTQAILRHALPNAAPAILALAGLQFVRIFDGMIVVETVFAWPGLGRLLVEALMNRDYPLIQACFLVIGAAYVLANLLVDIAVALLNPTAGRAV